LEHIAEELGPEKTAAVSFAKKKLGRECYCYFGEVHAPRLRRRREPHFLMETTDKGCLSLS
jgi:hypothetical protein